MIMSSNCWIAPNTKYSCTDIPNVINMDPDEKKDIENICNSSRTSGFTNEQLADLVNSRFNEEGLSNCKLSVLNNLGNKEFKDQCPFEYKNYCKTIISVII